MAIDRNVHEISLRSLVSLTVSNNVIKNKNICNIPKHSQNHSAFFSWFVHYNILIIVL